MVKKKKLTRWTTIGGCVTIRGFCIHATVVNDRSWICKTSFTVWRGGCKDWTWCNSTCHANNQIFALPGRTPKKQSRAFGKRSKTRTYTIAFCRIQIQLGIGWCIDDFISSKNIFRWYMNGFGGLFPTIDVYKWTTWRQCIERNV